MRMYGIVGLTSKFANWNADFDGYPKRTVDGIYASDKALKYVMRRFFEEEGKRVFYKKTLNEKGKVLTYEEKYKSLFGDDSKSLEDIVKNLLSCIDIKLFGSVVTVKNVAAGIRGPVQFTHGKNLYENTNVIREIITSQFASKTEKSTHTTIGEQILTDEAHYYYSFSLNENNLSDFKEILDEEVLKLKEEEIELFKKACLNAVDAYNSVSRAGCNNEFALFIETEEDVFMPSLIDYIKMEGKELVLDDLLKLIDEYGDRVKKVTIYYRPSFVKIKNLDEIAKKFELKEF